LVRYVVEQKMKIEVGDGEETEGKERKGNIVGGRE
jgi:hypothetical protein